MIRFGSDPVSELSDGTDVSQNPKRSSVRRDHQVVVLHHQIRDLHDGQVECQRLPSDAVIPGYVHPSLRGGVKKPGPGGILPDGSHEVVRWNSIDDLGPALAVVLRPPHVGSPIVVDQISDSRHVRLPGRRGRRLDRIDPHEIRGIRWGDVRPRSAAIPSDVHIAVVRAGPDDVWIMVGWRERKDCRIRFHAGLVSGDGPTGRTDGRGVGAGQVGRNRLPALPLVRGLPHSLGARVQDARIMVIEDDGIRPLHALPQILG